MKPWKWPFFRVCCFTLGFSESHAVGWQGSEDMLRQSDGGGFDLSSKLCLRFFALTGHLLWSALWAAA